MLLSIIAAVLVSAGVRNTEQAVLTQKDYLIDFFYVVGRKDRKKRTLQRYHSASY